MELYSRELKNGDRFWYVRAYYSVNGKLRCKRRSTKVRDDGTAKSHKTAEINGRDIEQSLALGKGRVACPTTLKQAIAALIAKKERIGRKQATIDITQDKGIKLAEFFGPNTPIEQCTDIDGYIDQAFLTRQSPTVKRELRELSQAFEAAGLVPPKMPKLSDNPAKERALTRTEQLQLLAAMPARRKDYIVMYLHMGLSLSEIYKIDPADCNWTRREARVRGTKVKTDEKGGRDRIMPMTDETYDILWARRNDKPMFKRWGNCHRDLRVYAARAGFTPVTVLKQKWRTYRLAEISFNDLRRTFATQLAAAGVPILHLMHLMGHKSTKMLVEVYARVGQGDHMHEAIAKLSPLRKRSTQKEA